MFMPDTKCPLVESDPRTSVVAAADNRRVEGSKLTKTRVEHHRWRLLPLSGLGAQTRDDEISKRATMFYVRRLPDNTP